jgi:chromosome segregation ATPase
MLNNMRKELETLLEQQEDTEQKIAQLKQAIMSFAPLAKESGSGFWDQFGPAGITDNIREILQAAYPKKLSPVEIKGQLKARGEDLSQHKNVMASIHSTLKRMLENEEITTSDEGLTYGWRRKYRLADLVREAIPPPPPSLGEPPKPPKRGGLAPPPEPKK